MNCHVQLVGNGRKGNDCWIRMHGWHRLMGHRMCRTINMPVGFEHDDFDAIYLERLRGFVEESSLDTPPLPLRPMPLPTAFSYSPPRRIPVATPGISPQVQEQLAAYLSEALRTHAAAELKTVSVPGPKTLRIRTALTDVIEGQKAGTPVATVHPGAKATLTGNLGSAEVASFVSRVSFEGEILDSLTGERLLLANIDHRIGKKREASATTSWASVSSAINQGVARLNGRFKTLRNC